MLWDLGEGAELTCVEAQEISYRMCPGHSLQLAAPVLDVIFLGEEF